MLLLIRLNQKSPPSLPETHMILCLTLGPPTFTPLPIFHEHCASRDLTLDTRTEVKHLKQLVRNIIDPTRDLGHVDRQHPKRSSTTTTTSPSSSTSKPPSSIKTTSSDPTPSAGSNLSVGDPKVTVPRGLQIAPDPTSKGSPSKSAASIPGDETTTNDTSARRKQARTASMTGADLRLDMTL